MIWLVSRLKYRLRELDRFIEYFAEKDSSGMVRPIRVGRGDSKRGYLLKGRLYTIGNGYLNGRIEKVSIVII